MGVWALTGPDPSANENMDWPSPVLGNPVWIFPSHLLHYRSLLISQNLMWDLLQGLHSWSNSWFSNAVGNRISNIASISPSQRIFFPFPLLPYPLNTLSWPSSWKPQSESCFIQLSKVTMDWRSKKVLGLKITLKCSTGCSTHTLFCQKTLELELGQRTVQYVCSLPLASAMQVAFLQCRNSAKHRCCLLLCDAVAGSLIHV